MIEIEQRYKIVAPDVTIAQLAEYGATLTGKKHVIDEWFTPTYVHSQADEEDWFDAKHGLAYRIRRVEKADGSWDTLLDTKQLTEDSNHNTFKEEIIMRDDEAAMRSLLEEKNYYNWLTIDKQRYSFASPDPELIITMDTIVGVQEALGLDTVLEIEYAGDAPRDQALEKLASFAETLDLAPELLFEKSLTVESMRVLARFK